MALSGCFHCVKNCLYDDAKIQLFPLGNNFDQILSHVTCGAYTQNAISLICDDFAL